MSSAEAFNSKKIAVIRSNFAKKEESMHNLVDDTKKRSLAVFLVGMTAVF
jgi:hypothetical protein